jgi:nicotinamidase-related amidase
MKALLIIDMQMGSFKPYSIRHDTIATVERINCLAQQFRSGNYPVFLIQHDGTKENCFIPGSDDWKILPEITIQPTDILISKTANDSFYNTSLESILSEKKISELFITGCATDFCVDTTIKSALSKDYKITVVADGHTTASRPHADAQTVINHYNWVWSDMSPAKHKIRVLKAESVNLLQVF